MAYTSIDTSGNTAVVSQEKWDDMVHRGYVSELKMKWLMGTSPNSIIRVKEDLTKKSGDAITERYASEQVGGTVRNNSKGTGNEGNMKFYAQRFVVNNVRTVHKMEDVPMTEKRVSFTVADEMRYAMNEKHAETADDDMVLMMADAVNGRVRGRYLYGAADSNWNATHATALQNIDNASDQLSSSMIGVAARKAAMKGVGVSQKVKPTRIMNGMKQEKWYMLMAHTYAIRDLVNNDAAFRNAQLNLTPGNRDHIFFTGSDFKGSWEGVLIYEYENLPLISSTIQCSHNLLLGARAGVFTWGQRTQYNDETDDLGHDYIAEYHDIRNELIYGSSGNNMKSIYNDGTNSHDYGLVNVFSAAVAD